MNTNLKKSQTATSATLYSHLEQISRSHAGPMRVLVVHDDAPARRRAERLLGRIRDRLGARLRLDCNFHRFGQLGRPATKPAAPLLELVFLAVSCSSTLPLERLTGITALLPALQASHGALAFLSGTRTPRRLERMLIEQFLHTCTQRADVAFFSGGLPGWGCPGCHAPQPEIPKRSETKRVCVLHATRSAGASSHPSISRKSKPAKAKTPSARAFKSGNPARVVLNQPIHHANPGQRARS
jgi:hypothetical protein